MARRENDKHLSLISRGYNAQERRTNDCIEYLVSVESPRAELHFALLLVERKVSNVDGARALVDGWRDPENVAVVEDHHVRLVRHFVLAIGAVRQTHHGRAFTPSSSSHLIS